VSAGFDAAARDPLAQMDLSADAFGWMAQALRRIAAASAAGRMALVLEGGYDLVTLTSGTALLDRGDDGRRGPRASEGARRRGDRASRERGQKGLGVRGVGGRGACGLKAQA
jgi:acetoin utilization deacetylase AcuC-like enzyme